MKSILIAAALTAILLTGCGAATTVVTDTTSATSGSTAAKHASPTGSASTGASSAPPTQSTAAAATGTQTKPSTATGVSTAAATTSTPVTTTTAKTTTGPVSTTQPITHLATFKSPSANIGCMIFPGSARCDIRDRTWSPPARPSSCPSQVGFGQGLKVGSSGVGQLVCAGDTALDPGATVLPYGTDSVQDGFICRSRTTGITCYQEAGGHGFFISSGSYRTF